MTRALVEGNDTTLQTVGERLTLEEFHDQKGHAVLLADVVNSTDVRVSDPGDRPRFTLEPIEFDWGGAARWGQYLDGDRPLEPRVSGMIDLAHTSSTEAGQDFVGADSRASDQGHNTRVSWKPAQF